MYKRKLEKDIRCPLEYYGLDTKHPLNYGNLSPQNRIYQSFCGDFFSIILMVFSMKYSGASGNHG